ncbi:MAG: pseudaminic acid biosynthesis-associated methylase [Gammaproteobacteria bacterium]
MTTYSTDQEQFWAGEFGDEYVDRNTGAVWVASNTALFAQVLRNTGKIRDILEFGANIGLNLQALKVLLPEARLAAVEINAKAAECLRKLGYVEVLQASILDFEPQQPVDLALIKGVLIHINPDCLAQLYDKLYRASRRYICIAEYYNPSPVEIDYRGHSGKLFKRDFAGEMLERYADLRLVDYAFVYRRDPLFPQDDITWFLLEKTG